MGLGERIRKGAVIGGTNAAYFWEICEQGSELRSTFHVIENLDRRTLTRAREKGLFSVVFRGFYSALRGEGQRRNETAVRTTFVSSPLNLGQSSAGS